MASRRITAPHRVQVLRTASAFSVLFVTCALFLMLWGCGSSSHSIKVALASTATGSSVDAGAAPVTVTATVTNDSKNAGVTFSLSPASGCGSIPASSTGTSVVYTPPSAASLNADCTAAITATSISNTSQSNTLNLTVKAITVSFVNPPTNTTLTAGASAITLTAAFGHDTATDTVKWAISAGCGQLVPSGLTAVYTPPGTSLAAACKATITAGSTVNPNLAASQTANIVFTVNPIGPLTATTSSLPGGVVNAAYSATLLATGGVTPYSWSVASGSSLPSWLALGSSGTNWTISGTPIATGTWTFALTVTDSSTPPQSATTPQLSVTVAAVNAACGSGKESVLSGQYAFILSGFSSSSEYMASIGSFTADGKGNITGGSVDSNSVSGGYVSKDAITATGSTYSIGSDLRGCATIVTPSKTFVTRFALESTPSGAAPEGAIEEWETGANPWIATGQILKQTVPTAISNGTYVYEQTGFHLGGTRDAVVGTLIAKDLAITGGEYDANFAGSHSNYSGITGSYTAPDANGRFTDSTSLYGVTADRVLYAVTASQFYELSSLPISSYPILVGKGVLQSGTLSLSGNLVYYASGWEISGTGGFVQLGRVVVSGSNLTATIYENDAGVWENPDPSTVNCAFTGPDANGRVATSGTGCGTYQGTYPPVFYLTGANTGVMMGTDPGVLTGQIQAQSSKTLTAGTYYFGTQEVVSQPATMETGSATMTGAGAVTGTADLISAAAPEPNQALSETLTVNSADGTITDTKHPTQPSGMIISANQLVIVDNQSSTYPTILVIKAVPTI